jgi:hypothetical protein
VKFYTLTSEKEMANSIGCAPFNTRLFLANYQIVHKVANKTNFHALIGIFMSYSLVNDCRNLQEIPEKWLKHPTTELLYTKNHALLPYRFE